MPREPVDCNQEQHCFFTPEEAGRLIREALDTSPDEPEPLVRLLLILFDNAQEPRLQDSIHLLIEVAYGGSLVQSRDMNEYLEAIRLGQNPMEEIRAGLCKCQKSET